MINASTGCLILIFGQAIVIAVMLYKSQFPRAKRKRQDLLVEMDDD